MDTNKDFKDLAEIRMMIAELEAEKKVIEDRIKAYMEATGVDTLIGDEHKATWKEINGTTFDKVGIIGRLADLTDTTPDAVKKMYTLPNPSKRFTFA